MWGLAKLGVFACVAAGGCVTATTLEDRSPTSAATGTFRCPASETRHVFAGMNQTCALVGRERRAVCWGGNLDQSLSFGGAVSHTFDVCETEEQARERAAAERKEREERPVIAETRAPDGEVLCSLRAPPREPPRCEPTPFDSDLANIRDMSFGMMTSCAVTMSGAVRCWGDGGLVGFGAWAQDLPALQGAVRVVVVGEGPARGLYPDGHLACGGTEQSRAQRACDPARDRFAQLTSRVVQLEATFSEVCAVTEDGQLICRGGRCSGPHCGASAKLAVRQLAVAGSRHCALTTDDEVRCWGQWGHVDLLTDAMYIPEPIPGLPPVVTLAGGGGEACAVARDGEVYCWGERSSKAVVDAINRRQNPEIRAERIEGVPPLCELAGGLYHMCGVAANGAVYCWGANHYGQLGTGDRIDHLDRAAQTLPPGSVDWSR